MLRPDVRVVGLEIDPVRVRTAQPAARPPLLEFHLGGFELAGLRPGLGRAMNGLRQYDESEVDGWWSLMSASGAAVIDGTCDELGRLASWITLRHGTPRTLTLAA